MGEEADRPLSAQVIVRDVEAAPALAAFFSEAGLEPGPMVGTSFAISGERPAFEATFGSAAADLAQGGGPAKLPLDALPADVAAGIEAIALQGPPDFGPTGH